ncbi:PSP1 domain-containing protein [Metarhizium album ARSEF 1941]|uniref:PSP1 domain-containing protein n=1 Tax=Metarhizium album (strain ARSEF 1941) TaxID=1081103 RepID=A0A0B2WSD6_METAS|nr:PSP1 domain-containing protein [Metarhizium album ARSEF 1941]KHN95865.1 PSP1 domain-containing protein [Metarhizium album ARSEF 1941]
MSSNPLKSATASKSGQGSFPSGTTTTQSLLLEKVQARTSTPDSEALASSDDEVEHRNEASQAAPAQAQKPVRRSSWLNDTSQSLNRPRKGSFASSSMSPTGSHPSTPSAEAGSGPWGSHSASSAGGRTANSSAFSWGTGIWNADRKDASSRLSEVLPSPTSVIPPGGSNSFFGPDSGLSQVSPSSRDSVSNSQIPFAIPLHPTPKTYRSQSYSVGQTDPETAPPGGMSSSAILGRARHPALQHRPSRPSMLSEMANDGSMLGKVKEVEDDDNESTSESLQGSFHQMSETKTIEMLARENAMLRQQQYNNSRIRPRASTGASFLGNGYETVPEESDFAVDELDEATDSIDSLGRRGSGRRMSEFGANAFRAPLGLDNRKSDNLNLKKAALWSSSPGFFGGDISQSRRHSFANMPTRQGSISSIADSVSGLDAAGVGEGQSSQGFPAGFGDGTGLANINNQMLAGLPNTMQTAFGNPYAPHFGLQNQFTNRPPSPHRNIFGVAQPRHNQLLHVVLFKCARADVFYIQEGTGLTVKPGDLVIVEADRGTDLGTVAKDNVDWQTAKELKEHYAEEHYKWLMMYSQGAAAAQEGSGAGLMASSSGLQGSAVGGMGPPNQHHLQEPNAAELRPKLIKRLAQNHEVHALRDKEGQEAKAKRVCMQKVKEHGLNMEILDAEFQMDWKKLTFYYFADSYINFNSLVTDLFKIYKTRIWMSAINPASFASPTLGIQAPSGIGPGAVGVGRASGGERRQNPQGQEQQQPQAFGRGYRPTFGQPFGGERSVPPASAYPPNNHAYGVGAFGNTRGTSAPYAPSLSPGADGFPTGLGQQGDFQSLRQRFPGAQHLSSPSPHATGVSPMSAQNDWNAAFQGLSLNTH